MKVLDGVSKMTSIKTKKLLVIDNDESILRLVKLSLEIVVDWKVLCVRSGCKGLHVAVEEIPDTILLDLLMPEMNGAETFQLLRTNPVTESIPIILFTGRPDLAADLNQLNSAIQGIIEKPFDVLKLDQKIAALLAW